MVPAIALLTALSAVTFFINPKPVDAIPPTDFILIKGTLTITDNTGFASEFDNGDVFIYELLFDKNALATASTSFSVNYNTSVSSFVFRSGTPNSGKYLTQTHSLSAKNVNLNVNGESITFQFDTPSPALPDLGGGTFFDIGLSYSFGGVYDFTLSGGPDYAFLDVTDSNFDIYQATSVNADIRRNSTYASPAVSHEFYFAGGYGTAASPFQISDWNHLDRVREDLTAYYELKNDLDDQTAGYSAHVKDGSTLANGGKGWVKIGDYPSDFTGSFDGKGFAIHDLVINVPGEQRVGMFGRIGNTSPSVVKNVHLVDATVTGGNLTGALVGQHYGSLENSSSVGGTVTGGDNGAGGLVGGIESGSVSGSYASGAVSGGRSVGGLVGYSYKSISNSYAEGSVTSSTPWGGAGGLVGSMLYEAGYATVANS